MQLSFTRDAAQFRVDARDYLAAEPVVSTVVASWADRVVADLAVGHRHPDQDWWVTVHDAGRVVGVAMRTAPFAPRPAYVLPMPEEAAVLLARTLHERGEDLSATKGSLAVGQTLLRETARLSDGHVEVTEHLRLHELGTLAPPRPAGGRLRPARPDEVELVTDWLLRFDGDADEQAGRARTPVDHAPGYADDVRRRIDRGQVWLWEDDRGQVVHLTGRSDPAYDVVRIGPVYTPPEQRGRGWASNAVAELSRRALDAGLRPCLFTDQANPTSNRIYEALGYRPVVDMADLVLRAPTERSAKA